MQPSEPDVPWWQGGVIYQIYPRSFRDVSGDGVGDLPGIVERLDHLVRLGVDAVWVSPFYPSPMADFGYDVADYTGVDPLFGTLEDADRMIEAAHARGLKVIVDFVPNHSSSKHPWFQEARASRDNPKRDWYIWADPGSGSGAGAGPEGGPPNNWMSSSGGPAWAWDEATGQYYLHKFLPEQPDLNWRNRQVREAMLAAMRVWLERGVDGFRLDVVYHCIKDAALRDDPVNPDYDPETDPPFDAVRSVHSTDQHPEIMDLVVNPMRRLADEFGALLVGEIYLPHDKLVAYYGRDGGGADGSGDELGVQLPYNFTLIFADWTAAGLLHEIRDYESHLPAGGWPNWVLGNHDQSRIATRVGRERARLAMLLLLTLRGTPTIYYGEEIGMEDAHIPADRVRDPWEINMPGLGEGRDPCRTPMRWTPEPNGGFCPPDVEPWLPMGADVETINVASQESDPLSMLTFTRALLKLRRERAALALGDYGSLEAQGEALVFTREREGERLAVALNWSDREASAAVGEGETLLSTHSEPAAPEDGALALRPHEGVVVRLA